MKIVPVLLLVLYFQMSCSISQKVKGQQGIYGKVLWLEGNLMPTLGDSTYQQRAAGRPIQRTILIHEATLLDQVEKSSLGSLYSKANSPLIKKIETQKDGTFKIALAPGKYSIFIQEEDGLFANVFDGEGIINPVTVETGKFTDIVIKVNYKAVY